MFDFSDPSVTDMTYANLDVYIAQTVSTTVDFTADVTNMAASGNGNDIPLVMSPSENFQFTVQISDVDLADPMAVDTLSFSPVTLTITTGDVSQALAAQAPAITFTGTATVTVNPYQCPNVRYMCVLLSAGSGALYTDAETSSSSNIQCTDIRNNVICTPGMMLFY